MTIYKNDLKDWTSFTLETSASANLYDSSETWKSYITLNANQAYTIADFDMYSMKIEGANGTYITFKKYVFSDRTVGNISIVHDFGSVTSWTCDKDYKNVIGYIGKAFNGNNYSHISINGQEVYTANGWGGISIIPNLKAGDIITVKSEGEISGIRIYQFSNN